MISDPQLGLITDIKHPFLGGEEIAFDGLVSYQRKIFGDRINWKLQLNVRNLLNDNLLIPVKANPVTVGDLTVAFDIDDYTRWRLMEGLDDIGLTLRNESDITDFETRREPWRPTTLPARAQ